MFTSAWAPMSTASGPKAVLELTAKACLTVMVPRSPWVVTGAPPMVTEEGLFTLVSGVTRPLSRAPARVTAL